MSCNWDSSHSAYFIFVSCKSRLFNHLGSVCTKSLCSSAYVTSHSLIISIKLHPRMGLGQVFSQIAYRAIDNGSWKLVSLMLWT